MTTAVRIKRKSDESPADTIVFAAKRARTSRDDEPAKNYAFRYAGTVDKFDDIEAAIRHVKEAKRRRAEAEVNPAGLQTNHVKEHNSANQRCMQLLLQHQALFEEVHSEAITDEDLEVPKGPSTCSLFHLYDAFDEDKEVKGIKKKEDLEEEKLEMASSNDEVQASDTTGSDGYVYDVYLNNFPCDFIDEDLYSLYEYGSLNTSSPEPDMGYGSDPGVVTCETPDSDSDADSWRNQHPEHIDFPEQHDMYANYFDNMSSVFLSNQLNGLSLDFSNDDTMEPWLMAGGECTTEMYHEFQMMLQQLHNSADSTEYKT